MIYSLTLRNFTADLGRAAENWKYAMSQFAVFYQNTFTQSKA